MVPVGYDGSVNRTSEKSASISLTSGLVEAVGYSARVDPVFLFNPRDQYVFVASLRDELNRLKLLRVAPVGDSPPAGADMTVEIVFQKTVALPLDYVLDVVMRLKSGERSFARRYGVDSREGKGVWERLNMPVAQRKLRAAKLLMAQLIPEIDAFVASLD